MDRALINPLIQIPFRIAEESDIDFLIKLEKDCFEAYRRSSKRMIIRSLRSQYQIVILQEDYNGIPGASIILREYKQTLRIISIAVLPENRGKGMGASLMNLAKDIAVSGVYKKLVLEVDSNDYDLINWYESFGFEQKNLLQNYYSLNKHAVKMELSLSNNHSNVIVTDFDTDFFDSIDNVKHIRANEYISNIYYQKRRNIRVFNFCNSFKYQCIGYYVSLLALARNQISYPNASLLRDINNQKVIKSIGEEIHNMIQQSLSNEQSGTIDIFSFFGQSSILEHQKLVKGLNNLYHAPLIRYRFVKKRDWYLKGIKVISLKEAIKLSKDCLNEYAKKYFDDFRIIKSSFKRHQYDLAILIDPDEKLPPSDKKALSAFETAAQKLGFYVEYITRHDMSRIPEFDALFIRTTTNVNNYTYDFSRYAYAEGLVVMDEPWSILRCANKIYLYETLRNAKVKMPKTYVINKRNNFEMTISKLQYPLILKLPDSAFSAGVYKVKNIKECREKLKLMFNQSELIIAQQYLPTEFDWRIGVLDGKPLYACKYYMAGGHWQIVDWKEESDQYLEGDFETIKIEDVPEIVLSSALEAARTVGDGLYGVDLKMLDGEVYVIEVNDNPSIEYQVEDLIGGQDLYYNIIKSFYDRLEINSRTLRTIT